MELGSSADNLRLKSQNVCFNCTSADETAYSVCIQPAVNLALIPEFLSRFYAACEQPKVIYVQHRLVHGAITAGRDGCKLQ